MRSGVMPCAARVSAARGRRVGPQVGLELDRAVARGAGARAQPRVVVELGGEEAVGRHHERGRPGAGAREGVEEAAHLQPHGVVERVDGDGRADLEVEVAHGADEQHRHGRGQPVAADGRRPSAASSAARAGSSARPAATGPSGEPQAAAEAKRAGSTMSRLTPSSLVATEVLARQTVDCPARQRRVARGRDVR